MVALNDLVTMKKAHPCGGGDWLVVRVGADIKLKCMTCGRFINLTRDEIKKRARAVKRQKGGEDSL
ncbi:MAG: DUF951 domain-containing protein [Clostridia bacterium]|nr:DUF951 domain-containing protein [Clostridia bacterium]